MELDAILESIPVFIAQVDFDQSAVYNQDREQLFIGTHAAAYKKFSEMLTTEQLEALELVQQIDHDEIYERQANAKLSY